MEIEVRVCDRDGNQLGKPLHGAKIGPIPRVLNGPGQTTLTVTPDVAGQLAIVDAEIQVWSVGEGATSPLFVGVPWTASRGKGASTVDVALFGIESYLSRRLISDTLEYEDEDQLDLGWALVAWTQTQPGGDLNIDAAAYAASGVTRSRRYPLDSLISVEEALAELTELSDGFDWSIEYDGADRREWTPYYPRRGVEYGSEWALEDARGRRNVVAFGYAVDGTQMTRRHWELAEGDGPRRLRGHYIDPTTQAGNRLLLESSRLIETHGKASETEAGIEFVLDGRAQRQVEKRRLSSMTLDLTVTGPRELVLNVRPGDTMPVDVSDGWQTADGTYRVLTVALNAAAETVDLTMEAV